MKHVRMLAPLALAALLVAPLAAGNAHAAAKRERQTAGKQESHAPAKRAAYRQFTGTVVALDGASITIEKGGKNPKQMVFAKSAGMRSAGDVQKDARVTVYWRDEGGRSVAHRVVVKTAGAEASH